jgi:hypothetical protein
MKVFYCSTCFECYYIHPQELVTVYCSVSVCTGVLVRFGWSRVVSECRLVHCWFVRTHIYSAWGLLRVCTACPTPRLNQSYELRPPWEQHLRHVPHRVRNGYNT